MNIFEMIIVALSLCADTFVSSISKGMTQRKINIRFISILSLSFAFFQTLMPFLGFVVSSTFSSKIIQLGNVISCIILSVLGINMIREKPGEIDYKNNLIDLVLLSISVSLDALAIGVTFSILNVKIIPSLTIIFITTFITSLVGVVLGNVVGNKYNQKALTIGGLILISIGLKILLF